MSGFREARKRRAQERANRARAILDAAEAEGRALTESEDAEVEAAIKALRRSKQHERGEKLTMRHSDGEGRHVGYTPSGREVRSYGIEDSIYETEKKLRGWGDQYDDVDPFRYIAERIQGTWEERAVSSTGDLSSKIAPEIQARFLDRLKDRNPATRAGARMIPVESNEFRVARVSGAAGFEFLGEGTTSSSTDMAFSIESGEVETIRALHRVSREAMQDVTDLQRAVEEELVGGIDEEMSRVLFDSTGDTHEPTGLLASTSVNQTWFSGSTGTGEAPASTGTQWDNILQAKERLENDNVPTERLSIIWNPRVSRQFAELRDGNEQPLQRPGALSDARFFQTAAISSTRGYGSTTVAGGGSHYFAGEFSNLVIPMRMEPSVQILEERFAGSFELGLLSAARFGVVVQRPAAFERVVGITT